MLMGSICINTTYISVFYNIHSNNYNYFISIYNLELLALWQPLSLSLSLFLYFALTIHPEGTAAQEMLEPSGIERTHKGPTVNVLSPSCVLVWATHETISPVDLYIYIYFYLWCKQPKHRRHGDEHEHKFINALCFALDAVWVTPIETWPTAAEWINNNAARECEWVKWIHFSNDYRCYRLRWMKREYSGDQINVNAITWYLTYLIVILFVYAALYVTLNNTILDFILNLNIF